MSNLPNSKNDEIKSWLNSVHTNDFPTNDEDSCSSIVESSIIETSNSSCIIETSSSSECDEELRLGEWTHSEQRNKSDILPEMAALTFNNVNISNSTNVYLGHIYNVSGNLNISVIKNNEELHQEDKKSREGDVYQQRKSKLVRPLCLIFPRYRWLAMDPLCEPKKIAEPVEIIVIGYTATTSSTVQARNIGIVRDLQTLNVEAQGFSDIIFNFLIGCDGVVYEGRGWGIEGDHTSGYNHKSIGIAFVGNFKRDVPTERALKVCKNLIKRGITEGHLSESYKLLTSCQTSPNANLDALYEQFKEWDNFCEIRYDNELA